MGRIGESFKEMMWPAQLNGMELGLEGRLLSLWLPLPPYSPSNKAQRELPFMLEQLSHSTVLGCRSQAWGPRFCSEPQHLASLGWDLAHPFGQ